MSTLAPYFTLVNEQIYVEHERQVKLMDWFAPTYKLVPFPTKVKPPQHIMHFITDDPLCLSKGKMAVRNVMV